MKVLRYEIKDLTPPNEILRAMQAQITAEREKRALIAASEGRRQEQINIATGNAKPPSPVPKAKSRRKINQAQGEAAAVLAIAEATARAVSQVAEAIRQPGGMEAVNLRVAERYVEAFGNVAQKGNTLILPANLADVGGLIASAMSTRQVDPEIRRRAGGPTPDSRAARLSMSPSVVLLILTAPTNCLMLAVLGSLARSGIRGIREAMRGALLVFVSLIGFAAQAALLPILGIVLANFLMAAGVAYFYTAVLLFRPQGAVPAAGGWGGGGDAGHRAVLVCLARYQRAHPDRFDSAQRTDGGHRLGHPARTAAASARLSVCVRAGGGMVRSHRPCGAWHGLRHPLGSHARAVRRYPAAPGLPVHRRAGGSQPDAGHGDDGHDRMLEERESEANTGFPDRHAGAQGVVAAGGQDPGRATRVDQRLSLLMLDIDRFKDVNDTHGHALGDAVLKPATASSPSRRCGRRTSSAGWAAKNSRRCFPTHASTRRRSPLNRLLAAVRGGPCRDGERVVAYTFSGGLVEWDGEEPLEALVQRADRALYAAKLDGRDRVVVVR